jgi:hypothetical protein
MAKPRPGRVRPAGGRTVHLLAQDLEAIARQDPGQELHLLLH